MPNNFLVSSLFYILLHSASCVWDDCVTTSKSKPFYFSCMCVSLRLTGWSFIIKSPKPSITSSAVLYINHVKKQRCDRYKKNRTSPSNGSLSFYFDEVLQQSPTSSRIVYSVSLQFIDFVLLKCKLKPLLWPFNPTSLLLNRCFARK